MPHHPALSRRLAALLTVLLAGLFVSLAAGVKGQAAPVVLAPGWNNFGYAGPAEPVTAALAPIAGQYDALWQFDALSQRWHGFNPTAPETSDLTDMTQGAAYWIHMLQPAVLAIGSAGVVQVGPRALVTGWNNIVQLGATTSVPDALSTYNASYSAVWHWNAANQHWDFFDPTAPLASDFTSLTQGQAYFVSVSASTPGATTVLTCYGFQSYQPQVAEVADALNRAGTNTLVSDASFRLADAQTSPTGGPQSVPGYIPPSVLKAIAWIESSWRQATYSVARGARGKTITSSQCAYGLLQVLTGMQISGTPTARQNQIGTDYLYNTATGAQILLAKWNMAPGSLPVLGRRDPHIIEDWYFALWAYHCFGEATCSRYGVHNNPDDPALSWPRPVYGSPTQQSPSNPFTAADYPYQELIFGRVANPPVMDGVALWQAIPVQLPAHGSIGFPVPKSVPEASAHLEGGQVLPVPSPAATPRAGAPVASSTTTAGSNGAPSGGQ
jgi:hypothetical protein